MLRNDYLVQVYGHLSKPRQPSPETIGKLVDMAVESFGPTMLRSEVMERLSHSDLLFVAMDDKLSPIGFAGLEYKLLNDPAKTKAMYLSGAVVKASEQGTGIYNRLTLERLVLGMEFGNCHAATTRTQNPIVEYTICQSLNDLRKLGTIYNFYVTRSLSKNAYGRMLTKSIPKSKNESLNAEYGKLNYENGDGYELVFTIESRPLEQEPRMTIW
jgi:hypothetical protein